MTRIWPVFFIGLSFFGGSLSRAVSAPSSAASIPAPPVAPIAPNTPAASETKLAPLDLTRDQRLNVSVVLWSKERTLNESAAVLTEKTGVEISAAAEIGQRRITILVSKKNPISLRQLMATIASVANLSWQTQDDGYRLYQADTQKRHEAYLMRNSEHREEAAREAKQEAMLTAIRQAIANRQPGKPSLADLLVDLTSEQLDRMTAVGTEPIGIGSGADQSMFHNHTIYARPFTSLTPEQQAGIQTMLNRPEYQPSGGDPGLAPAVTNPNDLLQSQVGFVADGGSVRLAIVPPPGTDVWVSPLDDVTRRGVAGADNSSGGRNPESEDALNSGHLLAVDTMPWCLRHQRLRFPAKLDRTILANVLEAVAAQTALPIIADDFSYTRRTPFIWLLTDRDEYTLEDAMSQIAGAFSHQFAYKAGIVRVQTLMPGQDLRLEPPTTVIARLQDLVRKRQAVSLTDYLMLAQLSDEQLSTLATSQLPEIRQQGIIFLNVQRLQPVLAFYSSLSDRQRVQAETDGGLPLKELNRQQREEFATLTDVGLPARQTTTAKWPSSSGLFVQRSGIKQGIITFLIASDSSPARVTSYQLICP